MVEIGKECFVSKLSGVETVVCELGNIAPKERGKIELKVLSSSAIKKESFTETEVISSFTAKNVLTSLDFTLENYSKVFSSSEFISVLK